MPQRGYVLQPRVAALRGYPGKGELIEAFNRIAVASPRRGIHKETQPRCG